MNNFGVIDTPSASRWHIKWLGQLGHEYDTLRTKKLKKKKNCEIIQRETFFNRIFDEASKPNKKWVQIIFWIDKIDFKSDIYSALEKE